MNRFPYPASIQARIDRLVDRLSAGSIETNDPDLVELTDWLVENGEVMGLDEANELTLEVIIPEHESANLTDAALLEAWAETDDAADEPLIDDERRIDFVLDRLRGLLDYTLDRDSDYHPVVHGVELHASDGSTILAGCAVTGYSFTDISYEWLGLFAGKESLWSAVRDLGWLATEEDLERMSRQSLLLLWEKDE